MISLFEKMYTMWLFSKQFEAVQANGEHVKSICKPKVSHSLSCSYEVGFPCVDGNEREKLHVIMSRQLVVLMIMLMVEGGMGARHHHGSGEDDDSNTMAWFIWLIGHLAANTFSSLPWRFVSRSRTFTALTFPFSFFYPYVYVFWEILSRF